MPSPYNYNVQPVNAIAAYRSGVEQRQQDDQQAVLRQYLPQAVQGDQNAISSLAATGGQNLALLGPLLSHAQTLGEQQRKLAENDAVAISRAFQGWTPQSTPQDTQQRMQGVLPALSPQGRQSFSSLTPDQIPGAVQRASYMPAAIDAARAAQEFADKHGLTQAQTFEANAKGQKALREPVAKPDQYTPAMMADFRQPDGSVQSLLAQQDKASGQWVTADGKRTALGTPESLTPTGSASRFQTQAMRVQAAAQDTINAVRSINALPITASTGFFGGTEDKKSFLGAPLNYFRQRMNPQDVQSYNVLAQGLAMNIASVEAQGLAPNEVQISQANARLLAQPGDTYLTKLQKMAALRQHAEGHLEPMLHSNLVTPEQKNYIRSMLTSLKQEIPYTAQDIIALGNAKDTKQTFEQFARSQGFKPPGQSASAGDSAPVQSDVVQEYVPGGPPAGAQAPQQPSTNSGWTVRRVQ